MEIIVLRKKWVVRSNTSDRAIIMTTLRMKLGQSQRGFGIGKLQLRYDICLKRRNDQRGSNRILFPTLPPFLHIFALRYPLHLRSTVSIIKSKCNEYTDLTSIPYSKQRRKENGVFDIRYRGKKVERFLSRRCNE